MIARILALVLALLLVGGGVAAWAAPASPDTIAELADAEVAVPIAPAIAPSPRTLTPLPDAPAAPAGRAHVDAVFRPPRLLASR